jgi:hypothetical protein
VLREFSGGASWDSGSSARRGVPSFSVTLLARFQGMDTWTYRGYIGAGFPLKSPWNSTWMPGETRLGGTAVYTGGVIVLVSSDRGRSGNVMVVSRVWEWSSPSPAMAVFYLTHWPFMR